jgi:2-dehydropantoate 2-reductase
MQFVVIGAGNMGCIYGGNLARIGHKIAFLDIRGDHVDHIERHGLSVEGLTGNFTVRPYATTNIADAPRADAVLVCVNAYGTGEAAAAARSILKEDGYCLTLQNGVGNVEILCDSLGPTRVLAGLSFQSGDLDGLGKVRHTNNGPTYIGELTKQRTSRLCLLSDILSEAGMNPVIVDDIAATIWAKFVHNCGINAICAITGLRPGYIQEIPELNDFQTQIIRETLALVRAKGIALPEGDLVAAIKEYCAHKFHRPSMMQHLDGGQRTEIDALNGYVARESAKLGLSAPYNDALTKIMKGREYQPQMKEAAG